jgi:uncharacterized protein
MQDQSPGRFPLIDGLAFAEKGKVLQGSRPVASFERIRDLLDSGDGDVRYEVSGTSDGSGRPALRMRISGALQLTCQRCLQAMSFPLEVDEMLVLARSEAEIEAQPVETDEPDRVLGGKEMAVGTLLEDEILLALPFAPRHSTCSGDRAGKGEAQASPFADLRGLLNRGGRAGN